MPLTPGPMRPAPLTAYPADRHIIARDSPNPFGGSARLDQGGAMFPDRRGDLLRRIIRVCSVGEVR